MYIYIAGFRKCVLATNHGFCVFALCPIPGGSNSLFPHKPTKTFAVSFVYCRPSLSILIPHKVELQPPDIIFHITARRLFLLVSWKHFWNSYVKVQYWILPQSIVAFVYFCKNVNMCMQVFLHTEKVILSRFSYLFNSPHSQNSDWVNTTVLAVKVGSRHGSVIPILVENPKHPQKQSAVVMCGQSLKISASSPVPNLHSPH